MKPTMRGCRFLEMPIDRASRAFMRQKGMDGLECLDMLRASKGMEQTPVILMSAGLPEGVQKRGRVQARSDLIFLEKPFEMDTLLTLIRQILEEN